MVRLAVRSRVDVEGRGIRHVASSKIVFALLTFIAFFACAGVHQVALASEDPSAGTDANVDHTAGHALVRAAHEPTSVWQATDAPPVCELTAIETEDTEVDAWVEPPVVHLHASLAQVVVQTTEMPSVATADFVEQFSACAALPRGPPNSHC